jgi:hypothetical protein
LNVIEEVGKVATGVVDAMKNSPIVLAIIVLQALVLILLYLSSSALRAQEHEIMGMLVKEQGSMSKLLAGCQPSR